MGHDEAKTSARLMRQADVRRGCRRRRIPPTTPSLVRTVIASHANWAPTTVLGWCSSATFHPDRSGSRDRHDERCDESASKTHVHSLTCSGGACIVSVVGRHVGVFNCTTSLRSPSSACVRSMDGESDLCRAARCGEPLGSTPCGLNWHRVDRFTSVLQTATNLLARFHSGSTTSKIKDIEGQSDQPNNTKRRPKGPPQWG